MNKRYVARLKFYLLNAFILLFGLNLFGQAVDRKEQLESQKIAFITKQLNLTVNEAQKFWPVYNEMQQKENKINQRKRQILKKISGKDTDLNEKELTELLDTYIKLQLEEAKLANEYHEKFKAVLPIKKVVAYYKAEERFKRILLQQVQKRKKMPR